MKKFFCLIVFFGISLINSAQVLFPYYTGFDNDAEKANWIQFRKGFKGGPGWGIAPSEGFSPPAYLGHDMPYGATARDTTNDWYVSPGFDFYSGGIIDSLKVVVHISDSITAQDHIGIFLLVGASDPAKASAIIPLADLTHFAAKNYFWKDTNFILVPATPGLSYIGINYKAVQNKFTVRMDNMFVNRVPIGLPENELTSNTLTLFPGPAYTRLNLRLGGKKINKGTVSFYNCLGQKICENQIRNENQELDISQFNEGSYIVQLDFENHFYRKKFVVLKP